MKKRNVQKGEIAIESGTTINQKERITTKRLKNGSLMVLKNIPSLRTITIGIGVKVGSVNEKEGEYGISHLIEHSVFKGTKSFASSEIKRKIEKFGGIINAFTSEEYTLFESKVPDFAAKESFDVLFELVTSPLFPEKEIESEKQVVLEEIAMYEDDPAALSEENLLNSIWGNTEYGRPIAGKAESVKKITKDQIENFFKKHYVAGNMVTVLIGNLSAIDLDYVEEKMASIKGSKPESLKLDPHPLDPTMKIVEKSDLNQANGSIGIPSVPRGDRMSYVLGVISTILGSGMSSILFDRLREKLGLVYSISSSNQSHSFCGEFTINFSTSLQNTGKALNEIKKVLNELPEEISKQLEYGKKKVKGRLLMSTESTLATMYMIVDDYFTIGKIREIDEISENIDTVTEEEAITAFERYMKRKWTLSFVGPQGLSRFFDNCEFVVNHNGD
ncbi:M16 family metallopeptidase [Athalassotoga saccharophila]|uniref:M16 family metallopeptidase n=1 Tax=Athalassotoga saccharophila TaxID=1441386 RepID=UPI00137B1F58|nr:pitrilysin family protein [Athalassotoga saccharophila]